MINTLLELIVDEGKWLTASMSFALAAVGVWLYWHRHSVVAVRRRVLAAMNLFFGVTIGTMAFGHLVAVTIKLVLRTLEGPATVFYVIGVALAIPSWWLICHTRRVIAPGDDHGRVTVGLNVWLAATLLALGLHNLPLAAPAFLNIGYHLHSRRAVGWAIVGLAVLVTSSLFIASVILLASGQRFEQFRGVQ